MPAAGGKWTPLTDPTLWADKARWAPDGKTIYFISNRDSAFFDVWGIEFDPAKGATVGKEFRVTQYDNPGRIISGSAGSELGVERHAPRAADHGDVGQYLGAGQPQALTFGSTPDMPCGGSAYASGSSNGGPDAYFNGKSRRASE